MTCQAEVLRPDPVDQVRDVLRFLTVARRRRMASRWQLVGDKYDQLLVEQAHGYELACEVASRKLAPALAPDYDGQLRNVVVLLDVIEGVRGRAQADAECTANEETYRRLVAGTVQLYDELVAFLRAQVLL
jgi:hypothetical protein